MKQIMSELTGQSANSFFKNILNIFLKFITSFPPHVCVSNTQGEEEELQRAKEAPCTCTVRTSTVEMELLELRYVILLCRIVKL